MQLLPRLHADEFRVTVHLVRHLVTSQAPTLCNLPLRPIVPGGTDHIMVRIRDSLVARFPRYPGAISATGIERQWLSHIQEHLSESVPKIVHDGHPDFGPDSGKTYPAHWSILSYLPGQTAVPLDDSVSSAVVTSIVQSLIEVLKQIRTIHIPAELPLSELPHSYRTGSLSDRLLYLTSALQQCTDVFSTTEILEVFQCDLSNSKPYTGLPVAAHCDLQPANLVVGSSRTQRGREDFSECMTGVIDWSGLSFGDPAVDLLPAWMYLNKQGRFEFETLLEREGLADADMWRRARAWALSIAVIAYPYYRKTRPDHADVSHHTVNAVLGDVYEESRIR